METFAYKVCKSATEPTGENADPYNLQIKFILCEFCGGGKLRLRHYPFVCSADISPNRGITPPYGSESNLYIIFYNKPRVSISCAARSTPNFPLWKFKPPCIQTANGSLRGASPESSMDEPAVNVPAAIMTWLS